MKNILSLILTVFFLLSTLFGCQAEPVKQASPAVTPGQTSTPSKSQERSNTVRKPAVAGTFYPADPKKLRGEIEKYIKDANPPEVDGPIIALVTPHAGYIYSGPVAAYDFKLLIGKPIKTVYILGPSHRVPFEGMAVYKKGAFQTPLGLAQIDEAAAQKLLDASPRFKDLPDAHSQEHSLEVMVPFIQEVLPEAKIVPVEFSYPNIEDCVAAAEILSKILEPGSSVIIASSDMSHYHPYDEAVSMDKPTLDLVEKGDVEGLIGRLKSGKGELCGEGPVITAMLVAKMLGAKGTILKYANSGDTAGTRSQVVGYGAVAFSGMKKGAKNADNPGKAEAKKENNPSPAEAKNDDYVITDADKAEMLSIARQTLDSYIRNKKIPKIEFKSPILKEKRGLFVTLHKGKNKDLRGCIGYIEGVKPLGEAIQDMAVNSSTQDHRFPVVKPNELDDIGIEISILSPLKRISSLDEIIPGKTGVVVKKGWNQGLFLPQVWEQLPDKDTFMEHLCAGKAGLPPDAWKDKDTEIQTFTVENFEEEP